MRFGKSYRDKLREAKRSNDMYADLAGKQRLDYSAYALDKPKRAATVRDPARVREADVNGQIRREADKRDDLVLWRNNRGHVDLPGGGRIMYGVGPNGAGDWIGYKRLTIMPDMVGETFALFVSVEAKAPDGTMQDNQQKFLERVNADGGTAIVAHSGKDLENL